MKPITINKIDSKDLLLYELPIIAEYIPFGFMQEIIAKYLAWKINRKYARYLMRIERTIYLSKQIRVK